MSLVLGVLRFVHIFSAIFWVGTTLFMLFFLAPTLRSLGPEGGRFMQKLVGGTRFTTAISAAGVLTVLAGLLMYGTFTGNWSPSIMLGARLPLTLGALAGIGAAVVGTAFQGRASGRLIALGEEIAGQGGPPAQAQLGEMARLQATINQGTVWSALLMVLAVIGMTWK